MLEIGLIFLLCVVAMSIVLYIGLRREMYRQIDSLHDVLRKIAKDVDGMR